MPNAHLYLHEVVRIVGTGSEAYKRHTGEGRGRSPRGAALVGTWQQCGSTGAWPRVVNLWEMRGWEHWAELLEYQYGGGEQPAELRTWWTAATEWRSGGFDRLLEPAPFCPTRQELIDRRVRGRACLQEIATVRPGTAEAYLDAVASRWLPIAAARGLTLVGAWRTAMRDTEAVLLWALPTFRDLTAHLAGVRSSRETRAWLETARTWRTDWRETVLVPSRWCVVHLDWGVT
ncbi:MAG TPA: NIPSNAP family containing protein [Candidatus Binatia bacterium]|nr:NIPSNAP family containing protein [Candidatus Binatia bacterium]